MTLVTVLSWALAATPGATPADVPLSLLTSVPSSGRFHLVEEVLQAQAVDSAVTLPGSAGWIVGGALSGLPYGLVGGLTVAGVATGWYRGGPLAVGSIAGALLGAAGGAWLGVLARRGSSPARVAIFVLGGVALVAGVVVVLLAVAVAGIGFVPN
jgi:hypothetical protein